MSQKRVVLVDDHPAMREGIAAILERGGDFVVVGTAGTLDEALGAVRREGPDILIADISLPDGSGLDLIRRVAVELPQTRILVLTMHTRHTFADRAFEAGAHGYLLKESGTELLAWALEGILAGDQVLDPKLTAGPTPAGCEDFPDGVTELTALSTREFQVFRLLAVGRSGKEVADILGISPKTVDNHRANLMRKLCATSVAELVRIAIRTGTIEP